MRGDTRRRAEGSGSGSDSVVASAGSSQFVPRLLGLLPSGLQKAPHPASLRPGVRQRSWLGRHPSGLNCSFLSVDPFPGVLFVDRGKCELSHLGAPPINPSLRRRPRECRETCTFEFRVCQRAFLLYLEFQDERL